MIENFFHVDFKDMELRVINANYRCYRRLANKKRSPRTRDGLDKRQRRKARRKARQWLDIKTMCHKEMMRNLDQKIYEAFGIPEKFLPPKPQPIVMSGSQIMEELRIMRQFFLGDRLIGTGGVMVNNPRDGKRADLKSLGQSQDCEMPPLPASPILGPPHGSEGL